MGGPAGSAEQLLLIPDLINFWLTGQSWMEETNASTTGLIDISSGALSDELVGLTGAPRHLFAPLIKPGQRVGDVSSALSAELGIAGSVVAVGSHDTASAVVAAPCPPVTAPTFPVAHGACGLGVGERHRERCCEKR